MSRVRQAAVTALLARRAQSWVAALAGAVRRRGDARVRAICPTDSWAFRPLYSNGRCPICGWRPNGYTYRPPLLTPYERYWAALAGIATVSVLMGVLVVVASAHS
ncbi:MAG: hypothetical protein ACYDAC_04945 [Candidatus Dormibacteria bacterium]